MAPRRRTDFEPLAQLMDEWSEAAGESFPIALGEYAALFDDALAAARAPPGAADTRAS